MIVNKYLVTDITLCSLKKWKLVKVLLKFLDIILGIIEDLYLNPLCEFCHEVCAFIEFYCDKCYCVEKNQSDEIVKINMRQFFLMEELRLF